MAARLLLRERENKGVDGKRDNCESQGVVKMVAVGRHPTSTSRKKSKSC